jgi:transcriptional regulator with XRE-family HTH domain
MPSQGPPRKTYIRSLRDSAGISRQKLAYLADCSIGTIAQYENGYVPGESEIYDRAVRVLTELNGPSTDVEQAA